MSYANSKAKYAKEKSFDQEDKHSGKCHAHGCPLPGSVSTGGPFFCSYHSKALPEQWGFITEIIKESKDILLALDEVQKIDVISWASSIAGYPPKWQEFHHLFDHKPDLQPTEEEQKNKGKYEYRLRNYLGEVTGVDGKARKLPTPRKPPTTPYNEMHSTEIF